MNRARENPLKVVSVISGPIINDHIHLIFPNDPLAARPISRLSKKRVSVGSLGSEICTQKQMGTTTTQNQNKQCFNQSLTGAGVAPTSRPAVHELKPSQHPPLSVIG